MHRTTLKRGTTPRRTKPIQKSPTTATRRSVVSTTRRHTTSPSTTSQQRLTMRKTRQAQQRLASGTSKPSKKAVTTGDFYTISNASLPVMVGPEDYVSYIGVSPQWRNTYNRHFHVNALYNSQQQRQDATKRALQSDNQILKTLRQHIAENKAKGMPFYLVDLPRTPEPSIMEDRLYLGDPASFAFSPNKYLHGGDNAANAWGQIMQTKSDMLDLWSAQEQAGTDLLTQRLPQNPDDSPVYQLKTPSSLPTRAKFETCGIESAKRVSSVIVNRVKNPALYEVFGLDGNVWHTRLAMYALHVWLYMRAQQHRPVFCSADGRDSLLKLLDADTQESLRHDWQFLKAKDRHNLTSLLLPWYRSMMINGDKALAALAGGDPQPMYSFLYRMFYRNNEIQRHDKKYPYNVEALRGWHYAADLEVYMEDPPDLAYLNHLIDYIVNVSYDFHTKSPRDYNAMIMGFIEIIDIPQPLRQKQLLGPITPEEMERWCYPIFRAAASPVVPGFFSRIKNMVFPEVAPTTNWFLNPKIEGPAWRPPQFAQTASGLKP